MIVAIDAGNTRTKWGVFDPAGQLRSQGVLDPARLVPDELRDPWNGCRRAVLSNVAGEDVGRQLNMLCDALGLPVLNVIATARACGVTNGYARSEQLGPDRWAALAAARHLTRSPCVVATAGTALTVDALATDGTFLGGLILPGWRLMQTALAAGTAGLSEQAGELRLFPVNTADAMASGAWLAMAGAVERMCRQLKQREGQPVRCLVSGGDAQPLLAALSSPAEIADNLVLTGLWLIERDHA